jgi:AraC family transcriptional regulator
MTGFYFFMCYYYIIGGLLVNVSERFNKAVEYIEDNLENDINYGKIAQIANFSEYHFRRMFSFLTGMPLGEYIRNRRMSKAASVLINTNDKIIDIATRFGYDSPDAFTKAFHVMYGLSPKQARKFGKTLKTFIPITFNINISGGKNMDYRIIEKEEFYIIGVSGSIPLIYSGPNDYTGDIWRKLKQADLLILVEYSKLEPKGIISAYANYEDITTEGTKLDLFVGIVSDKLLPERLMQRYDTLKVEASTWAVFPSCGEFPKVQQETWARLRDTWLPSSDYEMTGGPEISWYESYDFGKPDFKSEIWIPVKKQNKV